MRRVIWMVMLVGAIGSMAGCGGDDEQTATTPTTAESAATATPTPEATETAAAEEASPDSTVRPDTDGDGTPDVATFRGKTGDSFILVGQPTYKKAAEDAVKVTVLGLTGPFSGFDAGKGNQLIGVKVRFEGAGEAVYEDAQPHGELTLNSGETGKQTSLITGTGKNPCDNKSLKLEKGEKVSSCLAYEVPKGDKPKVLQYAASSGYGDTGVWQLK